MIGEEDEFVASFFFVDIFFDIKKATTFQPLL